MIRRWCVGCVLSLAPTLSACGHTSEAEQTAIYEKVSKVNRARAAEGYRRLLAARGASPLEAKAKTLSWGSDLESCSGTSSPVARQREVKIYRHEGVPRLIVSCGVLHDAAWRTGAFEGIFEGGARVLAVPAAGGASLAITPSGKILHIFPRRKTTRWHEIRVPGECNRMPSPGQLPRRGNYYLLEGKRLSALERTSFTYEGEGVRTECDSYVY